MRRRVLSQLARLATEEAVAGVAARQQVTPPCHAAACELQRQQCLQPNLVSHQGTQSSSQLAAAQGTVAAATTSAAVASSGVRAAGLHTAAAAAGGRLPAAAAAALPAALRVPAAPQPARAFGASPEAAEDGDAGAASAPADFYYPAEQHPAGSSHDARAMAAKLASPQEAADYVAQHVNELTSVELAAIVHEMVERHFQAVGARPSPNPPTHHHHNPSPTPQPKPTPLHPPTQHQHQHQHHPTLSSLPCLCVCACWDLRRRRFLLARWLALVLCDTACRWFVAPVHPPRSAPTHLLLTRTPAAPTRPPPAPTHPHPVAPPVCVAQKAEGGRRGTNTEPMVRIIEVSLGANSPLARSAPAVASLLWGTAKLRLRLTEDLRQVRGWSLWGLFF